jgi:predicted NBD/HSP70 family sugar kinase
VFANGQLVRAGRNMHPETGHICIDMNEKKFRCGCGNFGCAESFLSGCNYIERLRRDWRMPVLSGEMLLLQAKRRENRALKAFEKYGEHLAVFLNCLVVMFCPEKIILSGGFSPDSANLNFKIQR